MRAMNRIQAQPAPPDALLHGWGPAGTFRDGYALLQPGVVTLPAFIEAFYTTPLFKTERALIGLLVRLPASDAQAAALARGERSAFSAWRVAARRPDELLMADISQRTCSWLAVRPAAPDASGAPRTWLLFGSAIQPRPPRPGAPADAPPHFGPLFGPLLGFHAWYSRALLAAAARRLARHPHR